MRRVKFLSTLNDRELFTVLGLEKKFWLLPESFSCTTSSSITNTNESANYNSTNNNNKENGERSSSDILLMNDKKQESSSEKELISSELSSSPSAQTAASPSKLQNKKRGLKSPYYEAIRSFQEIPRQYSPYSKVRILKQAIKAIYSAVEIFSSNQYKLEYSFN
jgi:hypothetical protein